MASTSQASADPLVRRPWLHNGAIPLQGAASRPFHRLAIDLRELDDRSVPNPGKSVRGKPASITRPNYEARQLPCFRQTVQHIGWRFTVACGVTISIRSRA